MTFEDLCLVCEETYSVGLIKGNYGKPLSLSEYDDTIKSYIKRNIQLNPSIITIFLNNQNASGGCFINLKYSYYEEKLLVTLLRE